MEKDDNKINIRLKDIVWEAVIELEKMSFEEGTKATRTAAIDNAILFKLKTRNPLAYERLIAKYPNWEKAKKRGRKKLAQAAQAQN